MTDYFDEEEEFCSACNGSGEGMYDGSTCYKCKGTGVEPVEKDKDAFTGDLVPDD